MVIHKVLSVKRDIDICSNGFPANKESKDVESQLPGCEHGWFDSMESSLKPHCWNFFPKRKTSQTESNCHLDACHSNSFGKSSHFERWAQNQHGIVVLQHFKGRICPLCV